MVYSASRLLLSAVLTILVLSVCALVRERQHLLEGQRRHGPKHHEHGTRVKRKSWVSPPPMSPAVKRSGGRLASSVLSAKEALETQWELPSEVARELGGIVDLTVSTFISSWYSSMSDDPDVPQDVRLMLCHAFGGLVSRVRSRLHLLSFVVDRVLLALQLHLHWYSAMRAAAATRHPELFSGESAGGGPLSDSQNRVVLEEYARSRMYHEGLFSTERWKRLVAGKNGAAAQDESGGGLPLHSLMSNPEQLATLEQAYLRALSSVLVRRLLREEDHRCSSMRHLCREVLSGTVLHKVVGQLASPDGINGYLAAALQTLSAGASKPTAPIDGTGTAGGAEKTFAMAWDLVVPMPGTEEIKQPAQGPKLKVETQPQEVNEQGDTEGAAPETPRAVVDDATLLAITPAVAGPGGGSADGVQASDPPALPSPDGTSVPVSPADAGDASVPLTGSAEAVDTSQTGDRSTQRSQCLVDLQTAADRIVTLMQAGGEEKLSTESTDAAAEQLVTALTSALAHGLRSEPRDWDAFLGIQDRSTELQPQQPQQLELHTPASHVTQGNVATAATAGPHGATPVYGDVIDERHLPLPLSASQAAHGRQRGDIAMADGATKPDGGGLTSLFSVLERRRNPGEEDFFTGSTRWLSEGVGAMFSTPEPTANGSGPASAHQPSTHTPALPPVAEPSAVEEAQGNGASDHTTTTATPSSVTLQRSPWRAFSPRKTPSVSQQGRRPSLSMLDASRTPGTASSIAAPSPPGALLGRLFRLRRSPSSGPRSLAEALLESLETGGLVTCLAVPLLKEGLEEAYDKGALIMDAEARGRLAETIRPLQSVRIPISAELKARIRSRRRSTSKANEDETIRPTSSSGADQQQESKLDSLMGGLKRGSLSMFGPRRGTDPTPPTPLPPHPSSSPNPRLTAPQANSQTRSDAHQAASPRSTKPLASPLPPTTSHTAPSKAATASASANNGSGAASGSAPSAAGGGGLSLLASWPQWGSDASSPNPTAAEANSATPGGLGGAPLSRSSSPSGVVRAPWSPGAPAVSPRLSLSLLDLSTSLATSAYVPRSLEPPLSASRRRADGALVYAGVNTGIAETQRELWREAERATDERFPDPSLSPASIASASLMPLMRLFAGGVGSHSRRASRDSQQGRSRSPVPRTPPDLSVSMASERTERGPNVNGSGATSIRPQTPAAPIPIQGMSKAVMLRTAYRLQFLLASSRRLPLETLLTQGIWREATHGALSAEVMPQGALLSPFQPGQSKRSAGPTLFNIRVAPALSSTPAPQGDYDNPRPSSLPRPWMVRRRHSDFQRFDRHLRSQLSAELGARLPRLPPKRTASHSGHPLSSQPAKPTADGQQQRLGGGDECREGLTRYLSALHADPRLASSLEVAIFLTAHAMPLRGDPNTLTHSSPDGQPPGALGQGEGAQTFLAPGFLDGLVLETRLFGLLEEVFDLNSLHVVRRQVLAVAKKAARAFFTGSINQRLLTTYASITSVDSFAKVCRGMRAYLWPNDVFFTPSPARTEEDQARLQASVRTGLRELVPGPLGKLTGLLGQECTEQGLLRVFEALQSPFFTTNLAYSLLDLLLLELFPQDVDLSAVAHGLDSLLPDMEDGTEY